MTTPTTTTTGEASNGDIRCKQRGAETEVLEHFYCIAHYTKTKGTLIHYLINHTGKIMLEESKENKGEIKKTIHQFWKKNEWESKEFNQAYIKSEEEGSLQWLCLPLEKNKTTVFTVLMVSGFIVNFNIPNSIWMKTKPEGKIRVGCENVV